MKKSEKVFCHHCEHIDDIQNLKKSKFKKLTEYSCTNYYAYKCPKCGAKMKKEPKERLLEEYFVGPLMLFYW